jgi:hypothetical protein
MGNKRTQGLTFFALLSIIILLFFYGCGGGGGGSSSGGSSASNNGVPSILVSPETNSLRRGENAKVNITYYDSDGDILEIVNEMYYGPYGKTDRISAAEKGITGVSGSASFLITTNSTTTRGMYTNKCYVNDKKGNRSNIVEFSMQVNAMGQTKEQENKTPQFLFIN